jgi:maleylacetate reductase
MGLHHKLCHTLGGSYNLPHADTHTVMLPHTVAYNAAHAPAAMAPIALKDLGMAAASLERVADLAVQNPYPNPRPLDRAALRDMLQRAYDGGSPQPWLPGVW